MIQLFRSLVSLLVLIGSLIPLHSFAQTVNVSGSLQKWHKVVVTLTLPGNNLGENATTFKNRRMDVIFTDSDGNNIRVPGFFAADGNAANTSSTQGKMFKAYLRPNKTGAWSYRVLYYSGNNVALQNVNQLPAPVHNLTGSVGTIAATNKTAPDLRAKGRLQYQTSGSADARRYLKFAETGEHFLKLGPDSPENFLDYDDFDFAANRNNCGLCTKHFFGPHSGNYNSGDPTWKNNKGKNIIGAVNYLKAQKMNSMSMSLFGGDDKNVFPWVNLGNRFVFDVSKLEQWEIVLQHAEKNGLMLHFKLAENENWNALSLDQIKVYYREMVARFGHHLGVEWNISEEYRGTPQSAIARINWLASIDPWQNHRVIHTYPGEWNKYQTWLNLNAKLTGASVQSPNTNNYGNAYAGTGGILTWINKSRNDGTPWVVASDEQNSGATGVFTSQNINVSSVKAEARTRILWKTLIAGGAGVMWYGGGQGDFKTENFNRFNTLFTWSRYAILDFFYGNNIEFWKTRNRDNLVSGSANCLAEVGQTYVIYLENGGSTNLNLNGQSGNFDVRWFNPRNGGNLLTGNVSTVTGGGNRNIGNPPNATNSDWVALVRKEGTTNPTPTCAADYQDENGLVVMEMENLAISGTSWNEKTTLNGFTGNSYVSWDGANSFGAPGNGVVTTTIKINSAGKYRFQWRNRIGQGTNSTEHNDSWLRFPDASNFYGEKNGNRIYPRGSGKTPVANGAGADGWFKIYLSGSTNWTWNSFTSDNDSHAVFVEFDSPGVYTMEISGRSKDHLIDRAVLYKSSVTDATSLNKAETPCTSDPTDPTDPTDPNDPVQTVELEPISDAYIQGNNGNNNTLVRIENGNRVGYLKFDLSGVSGNITDVKLKFTVTGDAGSGNVNINKGTSNNWSETNLNNTNKPGTGALLGSINKSYSVGNTETVTLQSGSISGNSVSLILTATSGNDFAFASKENGSAASAKLVVTYETGNPSAPQLIANGTYQMTSTTSSERLFANASNNALMQAPSNATAQQWEFFHLGNNVYTIKNKATNRFLEVANAECGNGKNIATSASSTSTHQQWKIEANGSNYSLKPNHCLTHSLDRAGGQLGGNAHAWAFSPNNNNQKWAIQTVTIVAPTQLVPNGTYHMTSTTSTQRLFSSVGQSHNALMQGVNNNDEQQWIFVHLGNDVYTIKNKATNRFLEVPLAECGNSKNVGTWTSASNTHQQWKITANGSNYNLQPMHCNGWALDRAGGQLNANALLWKFSTTNNNQKWSLDNVNGNRSEDFDFKRIKLYPNPTNDIVTIEGADSGDILTIYDQLGRIVLEQTLVGDQVVLSLGRLESGVYQVMVNNFPKGRLVKQ